jgi:hypothetical protein
MVWLADEWARERSEGHARMSAKKKPQQPPCHGGITLPEALPGEVFQGASLVVESRGLSLRRVFRRGEVMPVLEV